MRAHINVSLTPADRSAVSSRHTQMLRHTRPYRARAKQWRCGLLGSRLRRANTWSDLLIATSKVGPR